MAYLSKEKAQKIRNAIKNEFPAKKGWKFSITNKDSCKLHVSILEAPIPLTTEGQESVNQYYIKERYADQPLAQNCLLKLYEIIIKEGNYYNNSDSMTDYFDVAFYYSIEIGNWNKPFKFVETR